MAPTGRILAVVLAVASWAAAKVLDVQANLGARQVKVGERAALYVNVSTDGDGQELPWPEVQTGAGLSVVDKNRGQSSSEQISIVNFKMERHRTTNVQFVFQLAATKAGTYSVGPILFQGRDLGRAQISVVDAPQDVRIATLVGKRSIYVGQQLPFTWRLTADRPFEVMKFPDVRTALGAGFYSETQDSQQLRMKVVVENGKRFGRLDLTGNLFALKAGRQTLPSTSMDYRIVERASGMDPMEAMLSGRDPFEAMMGQNRVVQGTARAQEVGLEILPVPEKNRPAEFQGGVGTFRLQAKVEKTKLRAGDGTTLTMELEGTGQPQASGFPVWQTPVGVESYPPQDEWNRTWKDGVLWTKLVRKVVLVPRKAGSVALDSVRFSWFDPDGKRFRSTSTGLASLSVDPAPAVASSIPDSVLAKARAPKITGVDRFWILFGKVSAALWALIALAAAAWGVVVWIRRRLSREHAMRRELRRLRKRLSILSGTLSAARQAEQLRLILTEALAVRLGEPSRAWTSDEIGEGLSSELAWKPEDAQEIGTFSQDLQAAEFAGVPLPENAKAKLDAVLVRLAPQ
jgi:hypothetical protein